MKRSLLTILSVFLILTLLNCNNNGNNNNNPGGGEEDDSISMVIGPEGGELTSTDGKLTLKFPPGALNEDTEITITKIDPADLPPEFDGSGDGDAYLLEPDGIVFKEPVKVSYIPDEEPLQDDGSLEAPLIILLTSKDGELEGLDNNTVDVDGDANTSVASGEINHFSYILAFDAQFGGSVRLLISGVPDVIKPGVVFTAVASFSFNKLENAFIKSEIDPNNPPSYEDRSEPFIKCVDENNCGLDDDPAPFMAINQTEDTDNFSLPIKYVCEEPPGGFYNAKVNYLIHVTHKNIMDLSGSEATGYTLKIKPKLVQCPSNEPPQTCMITDGSYVNFDSPCSFSSFGISHTPDGDLSCSGFGDNGTVLFFKTMDPEIFQHGANDLKIFDQGGHDCIIECLDSNHVKLSCFRPGASCSGVFERLMIIP